MTDGRIEFHVPNPSGGDVDVMWASLLLALWACSNPALSLHLAVGNSEPVRKYAARPGFTECDSCDEISYDLVFGSGEVRIVPEPILELNPQQISASVIYANSGPFTPEVIEYHVAIVPMLSISDRVRRIVDELDFNRYVVVSGSRVSDVGFVSRLWLRHIPVGIFSSEKQARSFAARLGTDPEIYPFDPKSDEADRVQYLKNYLYDYKDAESPRDAVRDGDPKLFEFLQKYPKYWDLMDEF